MQQVHTSQPALPPDSLPRDIEDFDDVPMPPSEDEIPDYEGEPMESWVHVFQMILLLDTLLDYFSERTDLFAVGDMAIYYRTDQVGNLTMRAPDVLIAKGVDPRPRRNWVIWHEGKAPDVVFEIISKSSAAADLGVKKQIYATWMHIPEYFVFDPETGQVSGFRLDGGDYREITPDDKGMLPCNELGLSLVVWNGSYRRETRPWLRWALPDGTLLPLREESDALREREAEQLRAERDALAAEVARLRERLGEG